MTITEAQLLAMWKKDLEIFEAFRQAGSTAGGGSATFGAQKSLVTLNADMDAIIVGTHVAQVEARVQTARQRLVGFLSGAADAIADHVAEYGLVLAIAGTSFADLWPQLFRNYIENNKRVLSRGFVFGSPAAAAANVGNGVVNRLNVDFWGQVIENQWADSKTVRCIADSVSGTAVQEEQFSIQGSAPGRDALEEIGSGKISQSPLVAISCARSQNFGLQNPSFSSCTPAGAQAVITDLTNWVGVPAVNGSTYQTVADQYRTFLGDSTPLVLRCNPITFSISQEIDTNGATFDLGKAYYFHVAVRRQNSADGTITLTVGRATATVNLTTLGNNAWSVLKIGPSLNNWYKNFGQAGLTVTIARTGGTVGAVDLDDVTIGEYQPFDGGLYAMVGGPTAFQLEDKFTWNDVEYGGYNTITGSGQSGNAIVQKWNWRALGLYLPSAPTPPNSTVPGLAGLGAGNVDNGLHRYWTTFTDANGVESTAIPSSGDVTVVDKTVNGQVTVPRQALPAVSTHLSTWSVYRSTAGTTTPPKKVQGSISLGTASYTDNTADASLGASPALIGTTPIFLDPP